VKIPVDSPSLQSTLESDPDFATALRRCGSDNIDSTLRELASSGAIRTEDVEISMQRRIRVVNISRSKVVLLQTKLMDKRSAAKRAREPDTEKDSKRTKVGDTTPAPSRKVGDGGDIESLLSARTIGEKIRHEVSSEILELLSAPTAKEKTLAEKFQSKGGPVVREYCPHGTKAECKLQRRAPVACEKVHFRRIIKPHTDVSLGDCSYLDTCRHMKTCKFVHYEIDHSPGGETETVKSDLTQSLAPPQWINCDIRSFDLSLLGKFSVLMMDPPWDIHMELPYGTMTDDEMRTMNIKSLQDDGYIFLWVTGRAMELGRDCLKIWGYDRVDELIWVKTNQLQRIIRTGRTGHWINHSKEHCLVGRKGNPVVNKLIDCDVVVSEVRETSRKPDEVYGLIERLSPGTRKIEIFGRSHNLRPGWLTLGNQLDGVYCVDPELRQRLLKVFKEEDLTSGKPIA